MKFKHELALQNIKTSQMPAVNVCIVSVHKVDYVISEKKNIGLNTVTSWEIRRGGGDGGCAVFLMLLRVLYL